jgi:hypothetical protein
MVQRTSWNCLLSALASRAEASILAYIILTWPIKIGAAFSADRRLCVLVTFTFQISSRLTPFWLHFYRAFTVIFLSLYRHTSPNFLYHHFASTLAVQRPFHPHIGLQVSFSDRRITFTEWQAGPSDPVKSSEGSVPTQRVLKKAMSGQE